MVPADCGGAGVSVRGGGADSGGWGGGVEPPELSGYSAVQLGAAVCDGGEDRGAGMAAAGLAYGSGGDGGCGGWRRAEDGRGGACGAGRGVRERVARVGRPRGEDER